MEWLKIRVIIEIKYKQQTITTLITIKCEILEDFRGFFSHTNHSHYNHFTPVLTIFYLRCKTIVNYVIKRVLEEYRVL